MLNDDVFKFIEIFCIIITRPALRHPNLQELGYKPNVLEHTSPVDNFSWLFPYFFPLLSQWNLPLIVLGAGSGGV